MEGSVAHTRPRRKACDGWPALRGDGREPFGRRGRVSRRCLYLTVPDQCPHVNPRWRPLGLVQVLEAPHRSGEPFDASEVLLDTSVQIVALTDGNPCVLVSFQLLPARLVRTTLLDIHQTRVAWFLEGFLPKA